MVLFVIILDLPHHMGVHKILLLIYRKNIAGFDLFIFTVIKIKMRKSKYCNTMKSLMSGVISLPQRKT